MMNKKNLPHIITVVSIVVFIVLGLASATTPFAPAYRGYVQTVKNDTGSTVVKIYTRDTGTIFDWIEFEKEKITASWTVHSTPMNNGTQMDLFYSLSRSSETPPGVRNQDIRMVDNNRIVYVKFNVPIALKSIDSAGKVIDNSDPIIFTAQDKAPMLTIRNNTGRSIRIIDPIERNIENEGSTFYFSDLGQNQTITVAYDIGLVRYEEQVTINNEDVTLTLTRSPPVVTIENNTGNTVNNVNVRNPGANWPNQNLLTRQVRLGMDGWRVVEQGTTQSTERVGSITNRESYKLWLGITNVKPDRYDIRIDDVQGNSYVKSNVQITQDMTLTFTQSDKR